MTDDNERTIPCGDCGELVGVIGGHDDKEWPEWECGRCGEPLCPSYHDASGWTYDGGYCCLACNCELDEEEE